MTRHLKQIIKGIGSVVDIAPNNNFDKYVSKQTPSERMSGHWIRAGKNISNAIGRVKIEQKKKTS